MGAIGGHAFAANRLGVSLPEYESHLSAGQRWCSYAKHWVDARQFTASALPKGGPCKSCSTIKNSNRKPYKQRASKSEPHLKWARYKVYYAVKKGLLPHASTVACSQCQHLGEDRKHEYHHHKGYAKKYALDVIPVCINCHKALDAQSRTETDMYQFTESEVVDYIQRAIHAYTGDNLERARMFNADPKVIAQYEKERALATQAMAYATRLDMVKP